MVAMDEYIERVFEVNVCTFHVFPQRPRFLSQVFKAKSEEYAYQGRLLRGNMLFLFIGYLNFIRTK